MTTNQVKHYSITVCLILGISATSASAQDDTLINDVTYTVLKRFPANQVKSVGQFAMYCGDTVSRKHGSFITFDAHGNEKRRTLYFYDAKRNRKFLGLKHGWWGWYGSTEKFFLGIRSAGPYIVDPCF